MVHIITGAPCSGKSTYIKQNAEEGDLIIDYDIISQALGGKLYEADGIIKQTAFKLRDLAIDEALKNPDADSWIIHTSPLENQIKRYEEVGAEFIKIDATYEECITRAEKDNRPQQTIDAIEKYFSNQKGRKMETLKKSFEIISDDSGTISGYFSTYDKIPDSYGDIVAPGAFTDTIKNREESGHPFPLFYNHDPNQIIGRVEHIEDTEKGPLMTASFFNTEKAQEVREITKSGCVFQFSFAYNILDAGPVTLDDGVKANELRKLDLFEVSIVPIPANQNAVVTEIKSAEEVEVKAGRRNSKSDEDKIKQAISLLQSVIDTSEAEEQQEVNDESNDESEELKAVNDERKNNLINFFKTKE